jgi:hypothetical protein
MTLHLTKVAFGCSGLDVLIERMATRQEDGVVRLSTRNAPKRLEELKGGSLFWIIRHQLVARSPLLGFEPQDGVRGWHILIDPALMLVHPAPRKAHQGWRYLEEGAAPADMGPAFAAGQDDALPPVLIQELGDLGLL